MKRPEAQADCKKCGGTGYYVIDTSQWGGMESGWNHGSARLMCKCTGLLPTEEEFEKLMQELGIEWKSNECNKQDGKAHE